MFSFVSIRANSRILSLSRLLIDMNRFHSTKLTYAQNTCPQEFCLDSYDCIGFDLDHTLCTYKLQPLFQLIYKALASFLVEKYNYPKSLSDLNETDLSFAQKGIILDKYRGNFLKLDSRYRIVKASHGTRLLSGDEVLATYGPNRVWEESKGIPQKLVLSTAMEEPFYVFKDYFVTPGAVICAKMVDILDEREGRKTEYSFWNHYIKGIFYIYERSNFKNKSGNFFPDLRNRPDLYLKPCSENVKNWLKNMHRDKMTFLLTSSNYDSAEFLAEYSLGKEWKDYFDIVITFAKKPGFFWKENPFCLVKGDSEVEGVKPEDMGSHSVYSQGNFKGLQEACALLTKTKYPKTVYFGDSLIEDVYAASELAGCDTVAIVDEMLGEGMSGTAERHPESKTLTSEFWGSFFSNNVSSGDLESNTSLWSHLLCQHSKLTIPNLESISTLQSQGKIMCFGNDSPISGFFPGVPKALSS